MKNIFTYLIFFLSFFSIQTIKGQGCVVANAGNNVLICPGTSTVIGTPAIVGYTYSWTPTTGLNNPLIAQPIASPTVSTTYTLTVTPKSRNLAVNGDFENGMTGFNTGYGVFPNGIGCSSTIYGSISVATNPNAVQPSFCSKPDHSPNGTRMLVVDGTCLANTIVWSETIPVFQNTTYFFSGFASNNSGHTTCCDPLLRVTINGTPVLQNFQLTSDCLLWQQFALQWNSGTSTTANIAFYDDRLGESYNDFSLDDISFRTCPTTTAQVQVNVDVPKITTASYFHSDDADFPYIIVPNNHNFFCVEWEFTRHSHFFSNYATGNTWFINNTQITSSGLYFGSNVDISNNQELIIYGPDNSLNELSIQVRKGTCALSQPTFIQVTPTPLGDPIHGPEDLGQYKPNYTSTYGNNIYSLGSGSVFSWSIPGTTFSQANPNNPTITVTFPSNITLPTVNATLTVTNAPHCNGTYPYIFTYNPSLTPIKHDPQIFPNPALNQFTISDINPSASLVEIMDQKGSVIKKIRLTGQKRIDISTTDFKPGIYFCNIYSSKEIQRKQFIISGK